MLTYDKLIETLNAHADEGYGDFNQKLLKNDKIKVIGVRVPTLRQLAKQYRGELNALMCFPDDYFEVTFLKCAVAGSLPFEQFLKYVETLVPLIDNWATCDCFAAPCIKKHQGQFLPYIEKFFSDGREFVRRYALVTLLHYYVEEQYLPLIESYLKRCDNEPYYVMMAAAWLLAEILVKHYDRGVSILQEGSLAQKINDKGIQKARESFRLTAEQKAALLKYKKGNSGKKVDKKRISG